MSEFPSLACWEGRTCASGGSKRKEKLCFSFTEAGEYSMGEGGHENEEGSLLESSKYAFPDYD